MRASDHESSRPRLARELGLLGLTATGVCAMIGAGINIIPFMIQRNVPGIGPFVLPAFALATLPVIRAGLAYKDLTAPAAAWYFRSTYLWAVVLAAGSAIYWREMRALRRRGVNLSERFGRLPID